MKHTRLQDLALGVLFCLAAELWKGCCRACCKCRSSCWRLSSWALRLLFPVVGVMRISVLVLRFRPPAGNPPAWRLIVLALVGGRLTRMTPE